MVGILVHGNNHFILSGALPDEAAALALVRHWSIVQIGEAKSLSFGQWQIRSKEFRENLEWAVIVPGDREILQQWRNYLENFQLAAKPSPTELLHSCLLSFTVRHPTTDARTMRLTHRSMI